MRDFVEYLQAYRAYVSANLGWGKVLRFALVWLAGMFAHSVDDSLGVSRLCFCALRNVETSSHANCELKSARPKIAALRWRVPVTVPSNDFTSCVSKCLLVALSGHPDRATECPLSGEKRTSRVQ